MRRLERTLGILSLVATIAAFLATPVGAAVRPAVADLTITGDTAAWAPQAAGYDRLVLTVGGPDGYSRRQEFAAGVNPTFKLYDQAGFPLPDGLYKYDLVAVPRVDAETRQRMAAAREAGDDSIERQLQREGKLPAQESRQSGTFSIRDGAFVPADLKETPAAPRPGGAATDALVQGSPPAGGGDLGVLLTGSDGTIRNSLCVGFDCLTSPTYSDTTILTMENNNRIKFDDTSVGSFPANDWEIEANSSLSGGANYLGFNDCASSSQGGCATDLVFAVEAGVRASALYVESDGDVGIGTSNPVLDLHIQTTNTPGIRLEQTSGGGFSAQSWDIAGNEASFFIRDVTSGSTLPFRIQPGSSSNSLFIASSGVGIKTSSPDTELTVQSTATNSDVVKVRRSGSTDSLFSVFEASTGEGVFRIFDASNNENIRLTGQAQGRVAIGCASALGADLTLNSAGGGACGGGTESTINAGSTQFTITSSRTIKENLRPVSSDDILEKIAGVGVYTYDFKNGGPKDALGLMAEDFHQVFGRGSERRINGQDVEMALWLAVQKLTERNNELSARLAAVEAHQPEQSSAP